MDTTEFISVFRYLKGTLFSTWIHTRAYIVIRCQHEELRLIRLFIRDGCIGSPFDIRCNDPKYQLSDLVVEVETPVQ